MLDVLDESCLLPTVDDAKFYLMALKRLEGREAFNAADRGRVDLAFAVKHYAGDVTYEAGGFVEMNKDEVPQSVPELLESSTKEVRACLGAKREQLLLTP